MIITPTTARTPEQQATLGHGVEFISNRWTLTRAQDQSYFQDRQNLRGFVESEINPASEYAWMLTMGFSQDPVGNAQLHGVPLANSVTTWDGQTTGSLTGSSLGWNLAHATKGHIMRVLVPALASTATQLVVTVSDATVNALLWATFTRVGAVLHPSPGVNGRLSYRKRTTRSIDGRVHVTNQSPQPLLRMTANWKGYGTTRVLDDLTAMDELANFCVWPSGLDSAYVTRDYATPWRKGNIARNCTFTRFSGVHGYQSLDVGPQQISFRMEEAAAV